MLDEVEGGEQGVGADGHVPLPLDALDPKGPMSPGKCRPEQLKYCCVRVRVRVRVRVGVRVRVNPSQLL